eukprot:3936622-Rhodomonas_salina.2
MDWTQLASNCQALAPAPPPPPSSGDVDDNDQAEALDRCTDRDLPSLPPKPLPCRCSCLVECAKAKRDIKVLSQDM